jgi:3-deoxy-D-manno-octulosonic-acid transferase
MTLSGGNGRNGGNGGLLRYRLLLRLLAPLILLFNAWQAIRARDIRVFRHRLGLCLPRRQEAALWLHAASVGELIAAQALLLALRRDYPQIPLVVTTTTPTGARLARQRLPEDVLHVYLPVDWPGAVKRFLRAVKPRAALIMETELWPNLFAAVARQQIPLIIVNGRLSARTLNARPWIRRLYAASLQQVSAVLARSAHDADAYIQLGAPKERVRTLGNIKFASAEGPAPQPIALGRRYVLAASTHEGEEKQLAAIWQAQGFGASHLLVIAPRHPQRRDDILKQLASLPVQVAVRSRGDAIEADTLVYLADTLGELEALMAGADVVFMGGSLVDHGGHNILEPARLGRPIVFGPHMDNFTEESTLLLNAGAARQVDNCKELAELLRTWFAAPQEAEQYGVQAKQLMAQQGDVLVSYLDNIRELAALGAPAR